MLFNSELRHRNKFAEAAVGNARDALANNPVIAQYLGAERAQYLASICDRTFVPKIRDGYVVIPRKYQDTDKIPIVAHRPSEPRLLSAQFSLLTPRSRSEILAKLTGWGLQGSAEPHVRRIEDTVLRLTANNEGVSSARFRRGAVVAYTLAAVTEVHLDATSFSNIGNPRKFIRSRPLIGIKYTDDQQLPSVATMAHELVHVSQFEFDPLSTPEKTEEKALKARMRRELEAYHVGAGVAAAWQKSEGLELKDLSPYDIQQLAIDGVRHELNEGRRDPFEPSGTLYNQLLEAGLDI